MLFLLNMEIAWIPQKRRWPCQERSLENTGRDHMQCHVIEIIEIGEIVRAPCNPGSGHGIQVFELLTLQLPPQIIPLQPTYKAHLRHAVAAIACCGPRLNRWGLITYQNKKAFLLQVLSALCLAKQPWPP